MLENYLIIQTQVSYEKTSKKLIQKIQFWENLEKNGYKKHRKPWVNLEKREEGKYTIAKK